MGGGSRLVFGLPFGFEDGVADFVGVLFSEPCALDEVCFSSHADAFHECDRGSVIGVGAGCDASLVERAEDVVEQRGQ